MSFDKLTEIERNTRFNKDYTKLSNLQKLKNQANDLITTFKYAGAPGDYYVTSITYSSIILGITMQETFVYLDPGSSTDRRVQTITLEIL